MKKYLNLLLCLFITSEVLSVSFCCASRYLYRKHLCLVHEDASTRQNLWHFVFGIFQVPRVFVRWLYKLLVVFKSAKTEEIIRRHAILHVCTVRVTRIILYWRINLRYNTAWRDSSWSWQKRTSSINRLYKFYNMPYYYSTMKHTIYTDFLWYECWFITSDQHL